MTIFYTPQGSDFQVNTTTANAQDQPTVTALAGGGYLVTWADESAGYTEIDSNGYETYYPNLVSIGQLFDSAGNAVGVEFPVGGMSGGTYYYGPSPVVTDLASGGFVAIWLPDGAPLAVAQIYDATGAPVGSTFELPNVNHPVFTADSLPSGGFVVSSFFNYGQNVLTQTFDSVGTQQQAWAFSEGSTYDYLPDPAVTSLPSGGYVVSYARDPGTGRYELVAQVFQADGTPVASEFVVAGDLGPEGSSPPTLTSLASGGFVISWASSADPVLYDFDQIDVMAQIYDAAGNAVGAAFMVHSETAGYQQLPDITALSSGGFVVAWSEDGSLNGRVFDAVGNMVGGEFLVTSDMTGTYPSSPLSISALTSGDFVVAWTDLSGDGSGSSVRSQIFTPTDVYSGTPGNDVLVGAPGDDQIDGLGGKDYLMGLAGNDVLNGGDGNDRFEGGDGSDTLNGGAGIDGATYLYSTAGVVVDLANNSAETTDGAFIDTLSSIENVSGSEFQDIIIGNDSNNSLSGGGGDDILYGEGGNDRLRGGSGADQMTGGTGDDSYEVDDNGDRVFEDFGGGTADQVNASIDGYQLPDNFERLSLTGSTAMFGYGNALANVIVGNIADNFLFGFEGNDSLNGGLGADTLEGGIGNDTLNGGLGADTLVGGIGNDSYIVDDIGDVVTEAVGESNDIVRSLVSHALADNVERLILIGTDAISGTGNALGNLITGNAAANTLTGGDGNDALRGAAGADTIFGGNGNDELNGGIGADTMTGGTDGDTYFVDDIGDAVTEAVDEGIDLVKSLIDYTLGADVEKLTLIGTGAISGTGNALNNLMVGNVGNNEMRGESGNDTLRGGGGGDNLYGGLGNDVLTGGAGADDFYFDTAPNTISNTDRITDFAAADDTIQLDLAVFSDLAGAGALAAGAFHMGTAAADADDRIIYDSATGKLYYDADGNGAGAMVQFAQLNAGTSLGAEDFFAY